MTGAELADGVVESELFGHERGSFTGAIAAREGRIAEAAGQTLLIDDLGRMPTAVQAKLLRALDDPPVFRPVGAKRDVEASCRFIFGLSDEPDAMVADGRLLPDLRGRMKECIIRLLPLAQRREDIVPLAHQHLRRCPRQTEVGGGPTAFAPEVLAILEAARWPWNVRSLEGAIERAYLVARAEGASAIRLAHLPEPLDVPPRFLKHGDDSQNLLAVRYACLLNGGRIGAAARTLGVSRQALRPYVQRL